MGNEQSSSGGGGGGGGSGVSEQDGRSALEGNNLGFHVLKVKAGSPAQHAGMETYFDYITHAAGYRVVDASSLQRIIDDSVGRPLPLILYSSKTTLLRNVTIIPQEITTPVISHAAAAAKAGKSVNSHQQGHQDHSQHDHDHHDHGEDEEEDGEHRHSHETLLKSSSYIGCSVRLCNFSSAHERVWHILQVLEGSPAHTAGLVSGTDYILSNITQKGDESNDLYEKDDFGRLVHLWEGKQLGLWVYSSTLNTIREVYIVPDSGWGGEGMLGCDIGYGRLHRIALSLAPKIQPRKPNSSINTTPKQQEPSVKFERHPSFPYGSTPTSSLAHAAHNHEAGAKDHQEHGSHQAHATHDDSSHAQHDHSEGHDHASHLTAKGLKEDDMMPDLIHSSSTLPIHYPPEVQHQSQKPSSPPPKQQGHSHDGISFHGDHH